MKKLLAVILSLALFASLAGCGAPAAESESTGTENQTTQTEGTTTETETEENKAAFDTSWASNEFEAVLPQLPFEGWTTSQDGDKVYEMELGGLKTETITDADGKTTGYGEDKTALISYIEGLADVGFSVEETGGIEGYQYEWLAVDANGNRVEFSCAEGYCWVTVTLK